VGTVLRVLKPGGLAAQIETVFQLRKKFVDEKGNVLERRVNLKLAEALQGLRLASRGGS